MENNLVVHNLDILNGRHVVDTNLGRSTRHPQDKPVQDTELGVDRRVDWAPFGLLTRWFRVTQWGQSWAPNNNRLLRGWRSPPSSARRSGPSPRA